MTAILVRSDHRHVSPTHVAIFRVVKARIQIQVQSLGTAPQLKIMKL